MELVHDGNLKELLQKRVANNEFFTDLEASTLIKYILKAVKYIHLKNIVHRDLKPCILF